LDGGGGGRNAPFHSTIGIERLLHATSRSIDREFSSAFAPVPTLLEVEIAARSIDPSQIRKIFKKDLY